MITRTLLLASVVAPSGCYDFSLEPHCARRPEACEVRVDGFSPSSGSDQLPTEIQISGAGLDRHVEVLVGDVPCKVIGAGLTDVIAVVPPRSAGSRAPVFVVSGDKKLQARGEFSWAPAPVIDSMTPTVMGPTEAGEVVLKGRNLSSPTRVLVGKHIVAFNSASDTELRFTAPVVDRGSSLSTTVITGGGEAKGPELLFDYRWHYLVNGAQQVLVDPVSPNVVYALGEGGSKRSADSGETFTFVGLGAAALGLATLVFEDGVTFLGTHRGLRISYDHGATWTAGAEASPIEALAALRGSDWVLYALIAGSLHVSNDLGDTWTAVGEVTGAALAAYGGKLYVGAQSGIQELEPGSTTATTIAQVPATRIAVANGLMVGDGSSAHTLVPGAAAVPVPLSSVTAFAALPDRTGWILADGSKLYRMQNGSLTATAPGLVESPVVSVAASAASADEVYAVQQQVVWRTRFATRP